jgi:uncharacterized membrane protein
MPETKTLWLIVTNVVLGLLVVLAIAGIATGVLCDTVARIRKRRRAAEEMDRDLREIFGRPRPPR